jgi:ligand-binding sensor domain-containing protein
MRWIWPALAVLAGTIGIVRPAESAGLDHKKQYTNTSDVRSIALSKSRVWAATGGGLSVHSRKDGRFLFKLTAADGLPGNSLRLVAELSGDRMLVGGDFGAVVLRHADHGRPGTSLEVLPIRNSSRPDTYGPVSALLERPPLAQDGGTFLIAYQRGLLRLVYEKKKGYRVTDEAGPKGWWHRAAVSGPVLALGDMAGTVLLRWSKGKKAIFLDGPVLDIAASRNGFVAATGEGLFGIENDRVRPLFARHKNSEKAVAATVLAGVLEGMLVGTVDGTIYHLKGSELKPVPVSFDGRVTALVAENKRLWVGVGGKGLHLFDGGETKCLRPAGEICGNHVTKLTRHRKLLVAGTFDRGACVLTKNGWRSLPLESPMVHGLAGDGRYLYVATSGGISRFGPRFEPVPIGHRDARLLRWFATGGGIAATRIEPGLVALANKFGVVRIWTRRGNRTKVRFKNHEKGVPFKMTAMDSAGGKVFAASETEGVKRLSFGGEDARHLQDHRELPENWVTGISAVGADEIWVATCQRGAAHVRGAQVRRFGKEEGLPDERLTAVAAGKHGAFLGTLYGVAWVGANKDRVRIFGPDDGIPDPRSASLLREGQNLWVGTEAGLARFRIE